MGNSLLAPLMDKSRGAKGQHVSMDGPCVCAHAERSSGGGSSFNAEDHTAAHKVEKLSRDDNQKVLFLFHTLLGCGEAVTGRDGASFPSPYPLIESSLVFEIPPPLKLLKLCCVFVSFKNISLLIQSEFE